MKRNKLWMVMGLVAIAGAITLLAAGGLSENMVFFLTPSELEAKGTDIIDQPIRLGGQVKPASVHWNENTTELRFIMFEGDVDIPVESTGEAPVMFRDGIGVVVEGTYSDDGVFRATNLMVKHSNEYAPPEHAEDVRDTYKSLIDGS